MAAPLNIDTLLARNTKYAESHQPLPFLTELRTSGGPPLTTVVVSCADPRVFPEQFLNLGPGEALVFRVIGGRISQPLIHEILTLDSFLGHGQIQNLVIVHHTDCGASHFTTDGIRKEISSRHPHSQTDIAEWRTGSFDGLSLADSVKADIDIVKADKVISDTIKANTTGLIYDLKTGLLTKVA